MFDVGFFELILIAIIALIVLGPERLPHAARMTGAAIAKVRRTVTDVKIELNREIEYQEMQERLKKSLDNNPVQEAKSLIENSFNDSPAATPDRASPQHSSAQSEKPESKTKAPTAADDTQHD